MKLTEMQLPGVVLIEPDVFVDDRGYFLETYRAARYAESGVTGTFVQDNLSYSEAGVLRGLHFQNPRAQAKLVYVPAGEIFDVAVDVRRGSPTFGRWTGARLSSDNRHQLYIPVGFAHGFCVLSDGARVIYKCTDVYDPAAEVSVLWNDPDIGIDWPVRTPRLSPKDAAAPPLKAIDPQRLPGYPGN
ncbi:MAG: dTDP-4-dehydrorhamnose 3,5-epimerase [Alphaproteobacteria bacterium]